MMNRTSLLYFSAYSPLINQHSSASFELRCMQNQLMDDLAWERFRVNRVNRGVIECGGVTPDLREV